jgi:hypothetical protein|tara:strand:- start:351 stop:1037 length:687 start_codon:yes stop_codon:yes gene_type:complete
MEKVMKLSNNTISVLKNYASINQNLVIKEGKELTTMSAMKNIIAKAEVEEEFPQEVAIYDLNEFLSCLSLFQSPNLEFESTFVTITEENKPTTKMKYFYSDPSVVTTPSKMITMPSNEITFTLDSATLSDITKASAVISSADLVLENTNGTPSLTVKDKKNDTANSYSRGVDTQGEGKFSFFFKVENLKLMDGKYTVQVSSKNISHMKNESTPIEYWIALEPESKYSV